MKDRQQRIDFHRNYCVHYTPREGNGCAAGQDIKAIKCVATDEKGIKWGPCIGGHTLENPLAHCPKWERSSIESAEARADSIERMMKTLELAEPVISAWRKKKPIGKAEVIECPVCNGKLHLAQSSYNGHVKACCETKDCINFIE